MPIRKPTLVWHKQLTSGRALQLFTDEFRSILQLQIDDDRMMSYGARSEIFEPGKDPNVFFFAGTELRISRAEKEVLDTAIDRVRQEHLELSVTDAERWSKEIAKFPGLEAALAKYGTQEEALRQGDKISAGLLLQWELRGVEF